ncbi:MAG: helix-turn-helix domain-containing protein [Gemmataceae bacterium]|nr:helix-turn-helix domain-containing protein [Gemmataceae bacterium]MCI0740972.1 helix-turn-helix domain-containing protein [Gemmataceae bacterium]
MTFGDYLRQFRKEKGFTLRALADAVGVDFSYLSKIENGKPGYLPGADLIRSLADALGTDPLELLQLADKVPPEIEAIAGYANARRFLQRAQEIASPADWDALLGLLERRHKGREKRHKDE